MGTQETTPAPDVVETIGGTLVQSGPYNDRLYVMRLHPGDLPGIVERLAEFASRRGYGKVFARIPARHAGAFLQVGYREEARVPDLYEGRDDASFLSFYLDEERGRETREERIREILALSRSKRDGDTSCGRAPGDSVEDMGPEDVDEMSEVYRSVFATYPFPIHDAGYLLETLRDHVRYFAVRRKGRIVALSSAEMDRASRCVEMTDFATLPAARGAGLARLLLSAMQEAMRGEDMITAYTICRALSPGMNITFARHGYRHAGTLTNNTNIAGAIESMNVWWRPLLPQ